MYYLSRVEIDTKNRQKIRDLTHLGAYHNWVEQSFPTEIATHQRLRHLWRIDDLGNKKYLLLLSEDKPDLTKLEKNGVKTTADSKAYDSYLNRLNMGEKLRFRLTANPTYKIYSKQTGKSRVVPHITVDQQMKWLTERVEKHGFRIVQDQTGELNFKITSRDWPILRRKNGRNVKLSRVTFEGILQITDLDKFKNSLVHGIGREKAFGMGLLTVIPIKD
ncbi:type I-E CRISPR-associated protein Cas6/Cse3/CasE [Lactobacillus hamsteri]|nr:type I-E CRISPR-associated protein Cas6/Cse3/CasE [Lactobacillus hamsteri]